MKTSSFFASTIALGLLASSSLLSAGTLPELVVPDTCGMQLRGNYSSDADLDQMVAVGVKVVRLGFHWEGIETVKGTYDFSKFDPIMARVRAHGLRVVGVLAFANDKLYGHVYDSDDGRQGYANYAAALAEHFKDDHVMWEIWNEPNTMTFWGKHGVKKGNTDEYATEYVNLVKATVPAMRKADPNCTILAGSTSNLWSESFKWCGFCFSKGVLQTGIDGWSVHPYGVVRPEDYPANYNIVRDLMVKNGASRDFPILDTERGFPIKKAEGWAGGDPARVLEFQAWNLTRQFLMEFTDGIRLTSWYEWQSPEFGINNGNVLNPAGIAYKVLIEQLKGYRFDQRVHTDSDLDFVMSFKDASGGQKLVAWTSPPPYDMAKEKLDKGRSGPDKAIAHSIDLPVNASGTLDLVQIDGTKSSVPVNGGKVTLNLTGGPQYLSLQPGK